MAKKKATKRKTKKQQEQDKLAAYRFIGWMVLAAGWLLVTAAMLSHDPKDWPAVNYGVANPVYANWIGKFGALLSHHIALYLGPGCWVVIIGVAIWLGIMAAGKQLNQLVLRGVGLVVMMISTSCILGILLPRISGAFEGGAEGAGGVLAKFINEGFLLDKLKTSKNNADFFNAMNT